MIHHGTVRGTQAVKPDCIEVNCNTVYIRGDIVRKSEQDKDRTMEFWEYTEDVLTKAEYDNICASAPNVSFDAWDDGLQTMVRTILYRRMDGDRAKAERNIRLGLDVEENTAKLKAIDDYCKAVENTKNAVGYPNNVPEYPTF